MKLNPLGQPTPISSSNSKNIGIDNLQDNKLLQFLEEKKWRGANEETPSCYRQLEKFLVEKEWKNANEETMKVMLTVANREREGWFDNECINNFPSKDLSTIDRLWLNHSNGRFGFSVQKLIYDERKARFQTERIVREEFGYFVGWIDTDLGWLSYDKITFDVKMSEERYLKLRYANSMKFTTPVGHLPVLDRCFGSFGTNFAFFSVLSVLGST